MISMNRVLPKTLPFVLIVFAIFTVSLTENLQLADGFSADGSRLYFDLDAPGETAFNGNYMIRNALDQTIGIELYTVGDGSEFLTFEKLHILEPGEHKRPEFFVTIPKDHPNNIKYIIELYALNRGPPVDSSDGGAGISINNQMQSFIEIAIGPNSVYTPPEVPLKADIPDEPVVKTEPKPVEEGETKEPVKIETLAEKLARINAANEMIVDDTFEESFEEEAVTEYEPEPEYIMEPKDIVQPNEETIVEETPGCGFIDWLLSLFGMAKC